MTAPIMSICAHSVGVNVWLVSSGVFSRQVAAFFDECGLAVVTKWASLLLSPRTMLMDCCGVCEPSFELIRCRWVREDMR